MAVEWLLPAFFSTPVTASAPPLHMVILRFCPPEFEVSMPSHPAATTLTWIGIAATGKEEKRVLPFLPSNLICYS